MSLKQRVRGMKPAALDFADPSRIHVAGVELSRAVAIVAIWAIAINAVDSIVEVLHR